MVNFSTGKNGKHLPHLATFQELLGKAYYKYKVFYDTENSTLH